MSTNTSLFPDINVWVALAHARHPHATTAQAWIDALNPASVLYICRFTQMGLLRVLTTQAAMGIDVMTQAQAWHTYDRFLQDDRIRYMDEPAKVEEVFRRNTSRGQTSNKQLGDGYLAAVAEAGGLRLITFDKALAAQQADAVLLKME